MIISYKHNFAFIDVPKCASTSCQLILQESGILDETTDICHPTVRHKGWHELLDEKLVNQDMECVGVIRHPIDRFLSGVNYLLFHPDNSAKEIQINRAIEGNDNKGIHNAFWDRFLDCPGNLTDLTKYYENVEAVDYFICAFKNSIGRRQNSFLSDNATVWAFDNFKIKINELVQRCGGVVREFPHCRKFPRPPNDELLTKDRQQQILDYYHEDYVLWEKAH